MQSKSVFDVRVYPYYSGIVTEVAPVVCEGSGMLTSGHLAGQQAHQLVITGGAFATQPQIGATYSWSGRDANGDCATSHGLYCTAVTPHPTFGAICDWAGTGALYPLMGAIRDDLVRLEALTDFSAILPAPNPAYGESYARLGKQGWLVMTRMTAPGLLGVLIDQATIPPAFAIGTEGISISATSSQTLQTVFLAGLTCARLGQAALFLKGRL